eukprot:scaffold289013_cov17-Tisochrysis_lutea.AAC.1
MNIWKVLGSNLVSVTTCSSADLDDLTGPEHKQHLQLVLKILREQRFFARFPKCELNRSELEYLGHIVSVHCRRVDPKRVLPRYPCTIF